METTQRQSYLDWLRIISIAGVLFLHSAMPYADHLWWHLKDRQTSALLYLFVIGLHLIRMPLLFFISGTVSFFMMQRKSASEFIWLRVIRLLVPLVVGVLIVVPPQIYIERLGQGYQRSYWDFYKTVFHWELYPKGSLSWHHLWFVAYLFIYDVVFAPIFMYLISDKSKPLKNALKWLSKGNRLTLLTVPSIMWYTLICGNSEGMPDLIHDLPNFVYWLLFVLAGFICILVPELMNSLQRNRRIYMRAGMLAVMTFYYFILADLSKENGTLAYISWAAIIVRPVTAWAWVFGLIGYGKQYLNRPHRSLNYLNQMVYPFYILHQTVIVGLTYFFIRFRNDGIMLKYGCTVLITLLITAGIFHFCIKPFWLPRLLFGLKGGKVSLKGDKDPVPSAIRPLKEVLTQY